jgi:hypothetical protein
MNCSSLTRTVGAATSTGGAARAESRPEGVMRLLCAFACLALLSMTACGQSPSQASAASPQAPTQPPPPPAGWLAGQVQGGLVMMSPEPDQRQRVILTLLPITPAGAPLKDWFGNQAVALAQSFGTVDGVTAIMEQPPLLIRVAKVTTQARGDLRAVFVGYASPHGFQMAVVMAPDGIDEKDARLQAASDYIDKLAATHFELVSNTGQAATAGTTTAQGAAQPLANPAGGQRLMALMPPLGPPEGPPMYPRPGDPIMQPRPQLPPDRDIPIKGSYFMTGIGYGAVNAGVGGSAYGSHAEQQILLLYANGVAVKSDIFGGNLAGHHQAEGFATLDVTDPGVVSQGGFGRWSQDGQTININWNYAQPEQLQIDGDKLVGGGTTYNHWPLADGIRLEGAYVRPGDPTLRGQGIVLSHDGTFASDGVNVTMGAELVMPYFPRVGYGAYEIKKGSLVLHYANGFTVAIALNIDGNTLLINNFGYQRVR